MHDAAGDVKAWVLTVPYLRPGDLRDGSGQSHQSALRTVCGRLADAARPRCRGGEALLAMGHLHVRGGLVSELSERRMIIGGEEAVEAGIFPEEAAYVALGHLHRPQAIVGRPHIRYAGSPLPLSIPEAGYPHQILQVDLDAGCIQVTPIRTPRPAELLRVSTDPLPLDEALRSLEADPFAPSEVGIDPLLEVRIREVIFPVRGRQRLEEILAGKSVRLTGIDRSRPRAPGDCMPAAKGPDARPLDPLRVFARRLDDEGELPDRAGLEAAFVELLGSPAAGAGKSGVKILAIRGSNLAALAGPFEVDFTAEPLRDCERFAISGLTGSGKSTLLDALCLALYHNTPRLLLAGEKGVTTPDVAEHSTSPQDPRTQLRRGCGEGHADVEFVGIGGTSFRARWEAKRA